ncbi:MAG TPA: hypothetical protein VFE70_03010 [Candidatus Elarobacter sp.]|nr:hypothetical protein [Candidatus Elarobacter sp.]
MLSRAVVISLSCAGLIGFALIASSQPAAATPAQVAVTAMSAYERTHGNTDIEQPECYIVQGYAQCVFLTAGGHLSRYDWLHLKSGKWVMLGGEIGNPAPPYMKQFGVPSAIAAKFEAHCKC